MICEWDLMMMTSPIIVWGEKELLVYTSMSCLYQQTDKKKKTSFKNFKQCISIRIETTYWTILQ